MQKLIDLELKEEFAIIKLINDSGMNVINDSFFSEMSEAISRIKETDSLKIVFLKGNEKVFSAGGDLKYISTMNSSEAIEASRSIQELMNNIESLPQITIALVEGLAFGGGMELALSCDICVATENAKFSLPELKFGIIPAGGGTIRMIEKAGYSEIMNSLFLSEISDVNEAMRIGVVQKAILSDEVDSFVSNTVLSLKATPAVALQEIKAHIKSNQKELILNKRESCLKRESILFGNLVEKQGADRIKDFFKNRKSDNG